LNTNAPRLLAFATALLMGTSAQAAVIIGSGKTRHMSCSAGVCTPTSKKATLNAGDLAGMLASGDVIVTTGSGAVSIAVTDSFSWTSTHRLTLGAQQSVSFRAPVEVAGSGAVTITSGAGAAPVFFPGGSVDFWDTSSSLIINGAPYTLAADIHTLSLDMGSNPSGMFALARNYNAQKDGNYVDHPIFNLLGTLDGLGHTIAHFRVTGRSSSGAFIYGLGSGGIVRNLAFRDAIAQGVNHQSAAILVVTNSGLISHVSVDGAVKAKGRNTNAAGLVLENDATIDSCSMSGSVQDTAPTSAAGGFVMTNKGTITNAHSSASVTSETAGGFVAENSGSISVSSESGPVTAAGKSTEGFITAGFVATNSGTIDRSFATGNVTGGDFNGYGAIAAGFMGGDQGSAASNSYATGAVSVGNNSLAAGFAFDADAALTSSWSSGAVTASDPDSALGFIAVATDNTSNDYWDTDTSGAAKGCNGSSGSCPGVTGLTTAQFQSGLPSGFDPAIWAESPGINNGYPYLIANPPQ
jgi:hypothetical protein